ncbi:hypothetical protein [Mesorhizobium sp. WSM3224]|uniref:hypothetical protein n=1 Tax=Mesorhizobium sp. WSM3224 TaxID=1040986 RepID=UPI0004852B9C|nr:hypothetical protein [Mesorhizobium sp. WSM3224]
MVVQDRLNSVNGTLATHYEFKGIVASWTGNHGVSAAAGGLKSVVLFPHGTPELYRQQVRAYSGTAIAMNWTEHGALLKRERNYSVSIEELAAGAGDQPSLGSRRLQDN